MKGYIWPSRVSCIWHPFWAALPFCSGLPWISPGCDCEFNECWCLYMWRVLHNKNVSVKLTMWGNCHCLKMHQVRRGIRHTHRHTSMHIHTHRPTVHTVARQALSDLTRQNSLRLKTYFQLTPEVSIRKPPITAERYPPTCLPHLHMIGAIS